MRKMLEVRKTVIASRTAFLCCVHAGVLRNLVLHPPLHYEDNCRQLATQIETEWSGKT